MGSCCQGFFLFSYLSRMMQPLPCACSGYCASPQQHIFPRAIALLSATSRHSTLNEAMPVLYNCVFDNLEGILGQRDNEADGPEKAAIINSCSPANRRVIKRALSAAAHAKLHTYYHDTWADMYAIAVILDPRQISGGVLRGVDNWGE
jgi:hypothetical protein